jgi:hypothetical protein
VPAEHRGLRLVPSEGLLTAGRHRRAGYEALVSVSLANAGLRAN